jgi:hypothetical protein
LSLRISNIIMVAPFHSTDADEVTDAMRLPRTRLIAIGYWIDVDRPELPDPSRFVDIDWDLNERRDVASYLNGGRPTNSGCGCSPCRLCGAANGFEELSDGTYLWPEGLAHYVLDHAVRLPDEVVQHALRPTELRDDVGFVDRTWWITATT